MTTKTAARTARVRNANEVILAANIATIVNAEATIAEAEAKRAKARDQIANLFGIGKHVVEGVGEVTVSENNVYNGDAFVSQITPWQFQRRASKRVLDRDAAKANFPDLWASVKERRGYRVSARSYTK